MTKPPKEITVAHLEVVVMPTGEIICHGNTVGWVKSLGRFLHPATPPEARAPQGEE